VPGHSDSEHEWLLPTRMSAPREKQILAKIDGASRSPNRIRKRIAPPGRRGGEFGRWCRW